MRKNHQTKMKSSTKTTVLLVLLCVLLCGCDPQLRHESTGENLVTTNGVVYKHVYRHIDLYYSISNAVPQ